MWGTVKKQWFLLALAVSFTLGYLLSGPLKPLNEMSNVRGALVFAVMWAMGVTLKSETIRDSVRKPLACLLAIGVNLLAIPILCLPAMWLLSADLFGGLFVAAIVPCTLASASVWTRKAGGDDSVAMMTTVVTNLACVAVVPISVGLVLAQQAEIDPMLQIRKLALLVVLPLVIAQTLRRYWLAGWADRNKRRISVFAQVGILVMVVFGAIACASYSGASDSTTPMSVFVVTVIAGGIHMAALFLGVAVARVSGQPPNQQIAVGISGSQKTLMVGLQIAIDCGVSVIPMLIFHVSQLVIDTVIADRWKHRYASDTENEAKS